MNILSNLKPDVSSDTSPVNNVKEFNPTKYIELLFLAMFFILPFGAMIIFFDPFTAFRAYLVGVVAIVTLVLLFVGGFVHKTLYLQRWTNYVPLIIFLFAFSLASYFSINRHVSLFGATQSYDQSLLFYVAIAVLYFVASNIKLNLTKILRALSLGTLISLVVSYLNVFGVSFPAFGVLGVNFNLVGTTNAYLALLVIVAGFAMSDFVNQNKVRLSMISSALLLILSVVYVVMTKDFYAISAMLLIIGYSVYQNFELVKKKNVLIGGVILVIALASFVFLYPQTRQALRLGEYRNSPRLTVVETWLVTGSTLVERPFWGAGIGTYANLFSQYRPAIYNTNEHWMLRLDRGFNPFFTLLATTGLVGLASLIVFGYFSAIKMIKLYKTSSNNREINFYIVATLVSILLLGGGLINWVLLFVLLGLVLQNLKSDLSKINSPAFSVFMIGVILFIGAVFGYKMYGVFTSNYYVFRAINSGGNIDNALTYLSRAVTLDEREDVYARQLVITQMQGAKLLSEKTDVTDQDRQVFQQLVTSSNTITSILVGRNPFSVANWELVGLFNDSISALDQNADARAIDAYNNAIARESTNPDLYMALGRVYNRQKNFQAGANTFATAVRLKNDYANAHYNLSYALQQLGAYDLAVTEMEIVDRIIPDGTDQDKLVKEQLAELRKLRDEAIAKNQAQSQNDVTLPVKDATQVNPATTTQELQDPEQKADIPLEQNEELDVQVPNTPATQQDAE